MVPNSVSFSFVFFFVVVVFVVVYSHNLCPESKCKQKSIKTNKPYL